ncbi:predicted protein [Postia placenta Mad-698-R]|nr:predicted protein [Postia placenta Mad-698-R]
MEHPPDCKILVITTKPEHADQFLQRIQALSKSKSSSSEVTRTPNNITPWTIVNKYYTADVHFETRLAQEFKSSHAKGVPAIIYVWQQGDPYREQVLDVASSLRPHDPDVSLAVKFGNNAVPISEDEEGTDEFLSAHGFEYIEGDRVPRKDMQDEDGHSEDSDSDIPGLPRVIDALSTIMWPSMVQSDSTRNRKSRARELVGWAREEEEEDGLRALISDTLSASGSGGDMHPGGSGGAARKSRMQREMEELERWLEEEDDRREREDAGAWVTAERGVGVGADGWQDMPTPTIHTPATDGGGELGFDDDFTEFVSAPSPHGLGALDADRLVPMHTGASYRSLASVSDFGGDLGASEDADADDPDLPSRAEIEETSRRIFGSAAPLPTPHLSLSNANASAISADEHDSFELHDDDDDFEMSAFDLSRVLSALQGMKEEIGGMSDEGERRRAAARVALGLVYGLQADRDD